jgi:hypothetical protein
MAEGSHGRRRREEGGAFVWREPGRDELLGLLIRNGDVSSIRLASKEMHDGLAARPFLYDLSRNRGLRRDPERNLQQIAAERLDSAAGHFRASPR